MLELVEDRWVFDGEVAARRCFPLAFGFPLVSIVEGTCLTGVGARAGSPFATLGKDGARRFTGDLPFMACSAPPSFSFSFSANNLSLSFATSSAASPTHSCPTRSAAEGDHLHFTASSSIRFRSYSSSYAVTLRERGMWKSTLILANDVVLIAEDDLQQGSRVHKPRPTHSTSRNARQRLNSFFISRSRGSAGSNKGKEPFKLANGLPEMLIEGEMGTTSLGAPAEYADGRDDGVVYDLLIESRRRIVLVVGLEGSPTLPRSGVSCVREEKLITGDALGESGLPGVATDGDGGGLGTYSAGMRIDIFRKLEADEIEPASPRNLAKGASNASFTLLTRVCQNVSPRLWTSFSTAHL